MIFKYISSKYSQIFLIVIVFISIFLSIYISIFSPDSHHPTKMFVEGNQLLSGLIPYKEVFITYGYITTALHALSILLFGKHVVSVTIITGIIYALTFPIFFLILRNFRIESKQLILSIFIIFLIHPYILLPWSNYIAYFFSLLGIYYITKKNILKKDYFLAGFLWSLACLSRQTYFLPLFLIILTIIFTQFFLRKPDSLLIKKNFFNKPEIFFLLIGFFLPIVIFFYYLIYNEIFIYWNYLTFNLSSSYLTRNLNPINENSVSYYFSILFNAAKTYLRFFLAKDLKSFFYLIIVFFNIFILVISFKKSFNQKIFYVATLCILMLSQNFHFAEVFRMSTSVIIGFITLIFYFNNNKIFKNFLYFFIFCLLFSWSYYVNNFFKSKINYVYSNLGYLHFQKMPKEQADFYEDFFNTFVELKSNYIINRNFNYTFLPMLGLLSDTRSHQVGTYYDTGAAHFYSTIPEFIELENSLKNLNDIVIFQHSSDKNTVDQKFKDNFFLYKTLNFPYFDQKYIQLLLPKNIKKLQKMKVDKKFIDFIDFFS